MTADDVTAVETGSETEEERSPWSQLASVAGTLHSNGVTRGERAELRRMRSQDVPPEIYWRLTEQLTWPGRRDDFDSYWMAVLPLMTRNEHLPGARPGRVLAEAGVKSPRLERWLRRDRDSAWGEAGRLLSITKGAALDWARFGYLLYAWDDPKVKREFAREYFRAARRRAAHGFTNDEGGS